MFAFVGHRLHGVLPLRVVLHCRRVHLRVVRFAVVSLRLAAVGVRELPKALAVHQFVVEYLIGGIGVTRVFETTPAHTSLR